MSAWKVNENAEANQWYITDGNRDWVIGLILNGGMLPEQQRAVLDRMAACVNACAGISNEALSLGGPFAAARAAITERGALLAALNEIVANDPFNQSSAGIIARKAIAAVQP